MVLLLNDHWWKYAFTSWWTGKLSDIAGLVLFPLVLQGSIEVLLWITRNHWAPSRSLLAGCVGATALVFSAIQIVPWAAQAYLRITASVHQFGWLLRGSEAIPPHLTADPTDLLTLPALGITLWIGWKRATPLPN